MNKHVMIFFSIMNLVFVICLVGKTFATTPVPHVPYYDKNNILKYSRIEKDWSRPSPNGKWSISNYNHPVDDFRLLSAVSYVKSFMGDSPEYMSSLQRLFPSMPPESIWQVVWGINAARPAERMAFNNAIIENITVQGNMVTVILNAPDVWQFMDERAPEIPNTVREWLLMDVMTNATASEIPNLSRIKIALDLNISETGKLNMTQAEVSEMFIGYMNEIRSGLRWLDKHKRTFPAWGHRLATDIRVPNRVIKLPYDIETGIVLLADGKTLGLDNTISRKTKKKNN